MRLASCRALSKALRASVAVKRPKVAWLDRLTLTDNSLAVDSARLGVAQTLLNLSHHALVFFVRLKRALAIPYEDFFFSLLQHDGSRPIIRQAHVLCRERLFLFRR